MHFDIWKVACGPRYLAATPVFFVVLQFFGIAQLRTQLEDVDALPIPAGKCVPPRAVVAYVLRGWRAQGNTAHVAVDVGFSC